MSGRVVRSLDVSWSGGRTGSISWDGLDGQGRPVAAGVYSARLEGENGESAHTRIVVRR